jgi:magnesium-transporting ATPase (P-type)
VPYNSENQWHAIVVDRERLNRVFMIPEVQAVLNKQDSIFAKGGTTSKTLIVKGIPEALLPKCTFFLDKDGLHTPLLVSDRLRFEKLADKMGKNGLRAVLITYMMIKDLEQPTESTLRNSNFQSRRLRNISGQF